MTLVAVVVGWMAGIALATWQLTLSPLWPLFAVGGLVLTVVARNDYRVRLVAVILIGTGLGMWRTGSAQPVVTPTSLAAYNDKGYAEMTGVVVDEPDVRDTDVHLRVEMLSIKPDKQPVQEVHGLALIYAPRFGGFRYGDKLRIEAQPVTPPGSFGVTYDAQGQPVGSDTFSYRDYLARSGVHTIISYAKITILAHDQASPILAVMFDFKERSHQLITRLLPSPQSALLTGILLGNDTDLPPEVADAFTATGTTHIIAISGENITIVVGLLYVIFGRLRNKWLSAAAILIGIGVYTLFVGASASVVRAAVMGGLSILALRFGRRSDGLTALAASVCFMTLLNPDTLFDMGLVLSSAATLGLILYSGPLTNLVERAAARLFVAPTARTVTALVSDAVLITFAAQITTLPIICLVFGRFAAVSFPINMLIIPAQAPIMSFGILAVAVGSIWLPAGQLVAWLVNIPVSYTLAIIRAGARLPGVSVPVLVEPAAVVGYYVILFGLTAVWSQPPDERRKWVSRARQALLSPAVAILGLAVAGLIWSAVLSRPDGKLHVWFLAVGQGNAVLIQTPRGAHVLVDGGQNPTQLRTALGDRLPFYQRDLDVLFVTQPKAETIAALPPLFDRYRIRTVVSSGLTASDDTYRAFNSRIGSLGVQVVSASAGYRLQTDDGLTIEVIAPPLATLETVATPAAPSTPPPPAANPDDTSLVLRLSYGGASMLLTSNLSPKGLTALLDSGQYLGVTVLELPSNGQAKSNPDDWLSITMPQVAVIEADAGSRTALPAPHVLDYLGANDVPVYRTDVQGTIEIATDGKLLWIRTSRQ